MMPTSIRPTDGRFTHYWGKSRHGASVIKRTTMRARLRRALRATSQWCRGHRHVPIGVQQAALGLQIRGHCAYYGITGNARSLAVVRYAVLQIWRKCLSLQSNKAR